VDGTTHLRFYPVKRKISWTGASRAEKATVVTLPRALD